MYTYTVTENIFLNDYRRIVHMISALKPPTVWQTLQTGCRRCSGTL